MEIEIISVDLLPSGLHLAVSSEQIPVSVNLAGSVHNTFAVGRVKVELAAVNGLPSGYHSAIASHVVIVRSDVDPAIFVHGSVCQSIVIFAAVLNPSSCHQTVGLEVVPVVVNLFPSSHHLTGRKIGVIISIGCVNPAFVQGTVRIIVNISVAALNPSGCGIGRKTGSKGHRSHHAGHSNGSQTSSVFHSRNLLVMLNHLKILN